MPEPSKAEFEIPGPLLWVVARLVRAYEEQHYGSIEVRFQAGIPGHLEVREVEHAPMKTRKDITVRCLNGKHESCRRPQECECQCHERSS